MTVYGIAGGKLGDGESWASNPQVLHTAKTGEERTGSILNELASRPDGPTVLHDLDLPGYRGNIDHVVVSGNQVTLVDSKVWRPGIFWTFRGNTRRGRELFPHADKSTMRRALKGLTKLFAPEGIDSGVLFTSPLLVVWPGPRNPGRSSFLLMDTHGQRFINGASFARRPGRHVGQQAADERIVRVLANLL